MPSVKSWQAMVTEGRQRSHYTAEDLSTAEKASYVAYEARVRELARSGQGVIAHDGLNQKATLSNAIALLAIGDEEGFAEKVGEFLEKAAWDIHYSALVHGLSAAEWYLKGLER